MFTSLKSGLRRARMTLVAISAVLLTALIVTPAHAAVGLEHLEGGAVAAVVILGTLAFAIVFEIWHLSSEKSAVRRNTGRNH